MKIIRLQDLNKVFSVLVAVFMMAGLVFVASPVFAATQRLSGTASNGNLRITVNDDGSMLVERYVKIITGSWVKQTYVDGSTDKKGSYLRVGDASYNLGYYGGTPATQVSNTLTGNQITTQWTAGGLNVVQKVAYNDGTNYYRLEWDVSNPTQAAVSNLSFFHGEHTNLLGGDLAGGSWVASDNTVYAIKALGAGSMGLQGVTAPFAYESRKYSNVESDVVNGDLNDTTDSNTLVSNGYALEWKQELFGGRRNLDDRGLRKIRYQSARGRAGQRAGCVHLPRGHPLRPDLYPEQPDQCRGQWDYPLDRRRPGYLEPDDYQP